MQCVFGLLVERQQSNYSVRVLAERLHMEALFIQIEKFWHDFPIYLCEDRFRHRSSSRIIWQTFEASTGAKTYLALFKIHKFSKGNEMVLDPLIGTRSIAKACLLEPTHRKLTDCDVDSDFVWKMMMSLLHVFEKQVLHPESDKTKSWKMQKAAKPYLIEQKAVAIANRTSGQREVCRIICRPSKST